MGCLISRGLVPFQSSPTAWKDITKEEIKKIVKDQLRFTGSITFGDSQYCCPYKSDVVTYLKTDFTDTFQYKTELFDCDDFSRVLLGRFIEWYSQAKAERAICFGIIWGKILKEEEQDTNSGHSVNFFIDETGKLWLVEPQNDQLFTLTSNSKVFNVFV